MIKKMIASALAIAGLFRDNRRSLGLQDPNNGNDGRTYSSNTRMFGHLVVALLALFCIDRAMAAPETIDLTTPVRAVTPAPIDGGAATNPRGHTIACDSLSFTMDGKPWIPIAGEFHYSRYPETEWREELIKMKAGGLDTVSTYVFWIHHEEEKGKFDWSGCRSLRTFLKLCQEVGLKAIVRMGPWDHGEVRNGGFPDWLMKERRRRGATKEEFMKRVERLYQEEAKQMEGLYWKDGGPIIAVQLDNENNDGKYLLSLKALARSKGIDVPFYTMTGWQGGVPERGLLPLFGCYVDPFWGFVLDDNLEQFFFVPSRCNTDLGSGLAVLRSAEMERLSCFPFACAEIGPGMPCCYDIRMKIVPRDVAAMAMVKLGCGNNMPGYYMYHGGVNPEGKLSYLNEARPNDMPVKDYDFQTALGACGEVREQFYQLRQQHLFLQDFGDPLARMPVHFPKNAPANVKDVNTIRWSVRGDHSSGFLFFCNHQPFAPLPEHRDVQFQIKTADGVKLIPAHPINVPAGSFGIMPFGMDCSGVKVEYATAQPLCHVKTGNLATYFFAEIPGLAPEFLLKSPGQIKSSAKMEQGQAGTLVAGIHPGTDAVIRVDAPDGKDIDFVVLTAAQATRLARLTFAGQERAVLSEALVFEDGPNLRLQADDARQLRLSIFPKLNAISLGGAKVNATDDGVFAAFVPPMSPEPQVLKVTVRQEIAKGPDVTRYRGSEEPPWVDAVEYRIDIPAAAAKGRTLLNVHYIGDVARLYLGDHLVLDNFFNGDPMPVPLWRIPQSDWPRLCLKVLPYSKAMNERLRPYGKQVVERALADGTLNKDSGMMDTIPVTVNMPVGLTVLPLN